MRGAIPRAQNLRFATVSRDRHTDSCERVHPPKHKCASHYSAVHSQMWQCAFRYSGVHKNVWTYRPWTDLLRANKKVRLYYSFEQSTPRFWREGCARAHQICVSLQFWASDTTFLTRGLRKSTSNLRLATVLGDRHHVFDKSVAQEHIKFASRYSFGRSTQRFWREGCARAKWNVHFATVLGDRHHVFNERVAHEQMKFAFRYSFGRSTTRF